MAQKNKTNVSDTIHQLLPFIHDCHTVRLERKSEGWEKPSNPVAEGKKAQIYGASWFFMQSHIKENSKYVMICNDITCPRD